MDGLSENGDDTSRPLSGFDLTRKVLSLVTFFAPAKKVTRRKAKALSSRTKMANDLDLLVHERNNNVHSTEVTMRGEQTATVIDHHLPEEAIPCATG